MQPLHFDGSRKNLWCEKKISSLTHKDSHFGGKTRFDKRQATRKLSEQVFWIRKMYGTIGHDVNL